jgi:hypothetical protein
MGEFFKIFAPAVWRKQAPDLAVNQRIWFYGKAKEVKELR